MYTQVELEKAPFLIIMQSDPFGNDFFPRETFEEALETIDSLRKSALELDDGVERIIGFVVNPSRCGVLDGLESGDDDISELCLYNSPADCTPEEVERAIVYLVTLPLEELRRRQAIVNSQWSAVANSSMEHNARDEAYRQLRAREEHLCRAIDRKVFPNEQSK